MKGLRLFFNIAEVRFSKDSDTRVAGHFRLDSECTKADVLDPHRVPKGWIFQKSFSIQGALSSAVEHFLHTEGVAGSNPAARTILAGKNQQNGASATVLTQDSNEANVKFRKRIKARKNGAGVASIYPV